MKITRLETHVVDGGWRPWTFVKVETDEGITGWGECSDTRAPQAVVGAVRDLETMLLGQDPRAHEARFYDMARMLRSSPGGLAARAIAGIECALVDIKARSLGISVTELLGGPTRERVRLYWSHCGTTRVRHHDIVGKPRSAASMMSRRSRRRSWRADSPRSRRTSCCRARVARGSAASTDRWDRTTNGRPIGSSRISNS